MAKKAEDMNQDKITALYCRLSVEDIKDDKDKKRKGKGDESNSISNQKQILLDYAKKHGYTNTMFFVDEYNQKTIQCYGVSAPHKHKKTALRVGNHSGSRLFAFIGFLFCWRGVLSLRIPLWLCAYTPCVHPCRGFVHPLGQSQKVLFKKMNRNPKSCGSLRVCWTANQ